MERLTVIGCVRFKMQQECHVIITTLEMLGFAQFNGKFIIKTSLLKTYICLAFVVRLHNYVFVNVGTFVNMLV